MIHISNDETFLIDSIKLESKCVICCKKSTLRLGWVGEKCDKCLSCVDPFEIMACKIVKMRRELMKLSRIEMAKLTGYSRHTIKKYEFTYPSRRYFILTKILIKQTVTKKQYNNL